jgi:hypothetical protein
MKGQEICGDFLVRTEQANGSTKVDVSPAEIKGCTGVSQRYAYDLVDEVGADIVGI